MELSFLQQLRMVMWKPFYFYLTPVGYVFTQRLCWVMYCVVVALYLDGTRTENRIGNHLYDEISWFPTGSEFIDGGWYFYISYAAIAGGIGIIIEEGRQIMNQGCEFYFFIDGMNSLVLCLISVCVL